MSLLAAVMYYPYYAGFSVWTLLANWLKLVCFHFPFAFFTQLYFIQPLIRTVFRAGLDRGHDCLILGAWGCGAFKNPVDVMAGLFREVCDEPEFRGRYRAVWFACLEKATKRDPAEGRFAPFYDLFGKLQ